MGGEGRVLSSPASGGSMAKIVIAVASGSSQGNDLAANFSNAVKGMFQGRKITSSSRQVSSKTSEGYPFISQNFTADDERSGRVFASVAAVGVNGRLAVFGLLSGSNEGFDNNYASYNELLRTLAFNAGTAGRPAGDNPLDRRNGRIEPPASSNRVNNPAANPAAVFPDPAKVKSDEEARKKRGVISGNVFGPDGKPWRIPGSRVMVYVWGVTGKEDIITVTGDPGGERTSYNIRVDERGHYELKIAGGGYRIHAQAMIPYGNEMVPVDLDALDGEPTNDYDLNSFGGIVKDFGLKLTGFPAGVSDVSNIMRRSWTRYPAGTHLHVLLTPVAPLLDGSQGWPIDIDYDLAFMAQHQDNDGLAWSGIPFSKYRVTARYVLPGGRSVPAKVDVEHAGIELADSTTLEFRVQNDKFTGPSVVMPYVYVNDQP
jgi:hypothetical protein